MFSSDFFYVIFLIHVIKYWMCRFIFHHFYFFSSTTKKKLQNNEGYLANEITKSEQRKTKMNKATRKKFQNSLPLREQYHMMTANAAGKKIEKYFCDWYECQFYASDNFGTYHFFFNSTLSSYSSFVIKRSFSNIYKDDTRENKKKFHSYGRGKRHKK